MRSCDACKKEQFAAIMTVADCGHVAPHTGMAFCEDCAERLEACEACGAKLRAFEKEEEPPPHTD